MPNIMKPRYQAKRALGEYRTSDNAFVLFVAQPDNDSVDCGFRTDPMIAVCTEGSVTVAKGGDFLTLTRGQSCFIRPEPQPLWGSADHP